MGFLDTLGSASASAPTTGGSFLDRLGSAPTPPATPGISAVPDPNQPTPGASLANVGFNLAKVPRQVYNALTTLLPGKQIGAALGKSAYGVGSALAHLVTGNPKAAWQSIANAGDENNANYGKIVGDVVQAAALPASLAIGAADIAPGLAGKGVVPFAARTAVNAGSGAALTGGNTAANGGDAGQIATNTGLGALGGGAASAGVEGLGALKNVISGPTEPFSAALKQVTPDWNAASATQKEKFLAEHSLIKPRIQEGGMVTGRSLIPNDTEKAAAAEVAKIPGYKPNGTNLETHTLVQGEIARQGQALEASLANEKIIVPKQEIASIISKATTDVPSESVLIARGDAPLANYVRASKAAVAQNDGTLVGVLKVRKELDAAYENARGKLAYNSDKIAPLDEIHQQARNALNDYLASHAQNTDVKAALRAQSLLYRADDVIAPKAAREGSSALDRVKTKISEHPAVASGLGGAAAVEGARRLLTGHF